MGFQLLNLLLDTVNKQIIKAIYRIVEKLNTI